MRKVTLILTLLVGFVTGANATTWSCGCLCCVNENCTGYSNFLGWSHLDTAQCNGNVKHDTAWCMAACTADYQAICGAPDFLSANCPNNDGVANFAKQKRRNPLH
jgi:hypothetical protein